MDQIPEDMQSDPRDFGVSVIYEQGKMDLVKSTSIIYTEQKFPDSTRKIIERAPLIVREWKFSELYGQLEKFLTGEDRRKLINSSKLETFPFLAILQLELQFKGDLDSAASGALVGPRHVLTAAHNVYDRKKKVWASFVKVFTPFGPGNVLRAYKFDDCDLALLVLDDNFGELTGWFGMSAYLNLDKLEKKVVRVTGYPVEKENFGKMLSHKGKPKRNVEIEGEITYEIDTTPGQSGSPVWLKGMIENSIVGVHIGRGRDADEYEYGDEENFNKGVVLTQERLKTIIHWIEETYNVKTS